jgi:NAD+ diphosphatase
MIPTLRSSALLDRQSQLRSDAAYLKALAEHDDARFMLLVGYKPVMHSNQSRTEAALRWLKARELSDAGVPLEAPLFLGVDRATGAGRFALSLAEHRLNALPLALGLSRPAVDLRALAMQGVMSSEELSLAGLAKALAHWHESARCCGRCGGHTRARDGGWRRRCWACGTDHFPRTDPVVIMLVEHPDRQRCLLGRSARFAAGMYSALAGFVEPGEDIFDAVRREVKEEAGIEIGEVAFHSAQPWPFPHSLMIGCIAQATTVEITIDPEELEAARWFDRTESLQLLDGNHPEGLTGPGRQAIARALLHSFVEAEA